MVRLYSLCKAGKQAEAAKGSQAETAHVDVGLLTRFTIKRLDMVGENVGQNPGTNPRPRSKSPASLKSWVNQDIPKLVVK